MDGNSKAVVAARTDYARETRDLEGQTKKTAYTRFLQTEQDKALLRVMAGLRAAGNMSQYLTMLLHEDAVRQGLLS